ncbi:MAG: hypothetical protein HYV53_01220 [Parcubacteria group bacterium]|nr:hypothetical protein [Parcubacteria group bacterium]
MARANENRDWKIYHDLAQLLIARARKLYLSDSDFKIELDGAVYVLDSTVIELCLATFKWAYFELGKSAVKIHTQLDLRGNNPSLKRLSFFIIRYAEKQKDDRMFGRLILTNRKFFSSYSGTV